MINKQTWVAIFVSSILWIIVSYQYGTYKTSLEYEEAISDIIRQHNEEEELAQAEIVLYKDELNDAVTELESVQAKLTELHKSIENQPSIQWRSEEGRITAYSPLDDKNGINSEGLSDTTSIGMKVGWGRFAVDPSRIPYGSQMMIIYPDGTVETGIAADTGGALRKEGALKIDVYRDTFKQANSFGKKRAVVLWKPASF